MQVLTQWSEQMNKVGTDMIVALQQGFPNGEGFFMGVTRLADPQFICFIVFPFLAALDSNVAALFLATAMVSDWTNVLIKWVIRGHRPYWWVRETNVYGTLTRPELFHAPGTCETGPGMPSGHVMVSSAVGFMLINTFLQQMVAPSNVSKKGKVMIECLLWTVYVVYLVLASTSRIYIAAHFPHQCIMGFICGIIAAKVVAGQMSELQEISRNTALKLSFGMIAMSFAFYWCQKGLGIDPQWSVHLAFKWCSDINYIHVNTTPLYSLVKECGNGLGLLLSLSTRHHHKMNEEQEPDSLKVFATKSACIVLCVLGVQQVERAIPSSDARVFYACHYVVNAFSVYLLLVTLPWLCSSFKKVKEE